MKLNCELQEGMVVEIGISNHGALEKYNGCIGQIHNISVDRFGYLSITVTVDREEHWTKWSYSADELTPLDFTGEEI